MKTISASIIMLLSSVPGYGNTPPEAPATSEHPARLGHADNNTIQRRVISDKLCTQHGRIKEYIACEALSRKQDGVQLNLRRLFVMPEHSQFIADSAFFKMIVHNNEDKICTNKIAPVMAKKFLDLDFCISYCPLNHYNNLTVERDILHTDLFYFIPYDESAEEQMVYVLTWNPEKEISTTWEIQDNAILFPVKGSQEKKIGIIVSPLMMIGKPDKKQTVMAGCIGSTQIWCSVHFKLVDSSGATWVLSWRKMPKKDFETLQGNGKKH